VTSSRVGGATDLIFSGREDLGSRRILALSFDDGPSETTPAVLDVLRDHGARATFFVVGYHVDARPEIVRRAVDEGHELGNHTYDHVDAAHERDDDVLRDQITRTSAAIERAAGSAPRLIRPPYGKDVARVARLGRELGLDPTILWSAQGWDWDTTPSETIVDLVLRDCAPGGVVVLHDGVPPQGGTSRVPMLAALPRILAALTGDGYEVVTVSELLAA
jgi:peptidoglycan/xylan/chitin deacetylase (PgdA/CDA1 family)